MNTAVPEKHRNKEQFVICNETEIQGVLISAFTESGMGRHPELFDTRREAEIQVADSLRCRCEAVIEGHMDFDSLDYRECVQPVKVDVAGVLHFESGERWEGDENGELVL